MKILLDNGVPRGLVGILEPHSVEEARSRGWETLVNGELIQAAELAGFELMIISDKNIRYQQNLEGRSLALLVLGNSQWPMVRSATADILLAVSRVNPGSYAEVSVPFRSSGARRSDLQGSED